MAPLRNVPSLSLLTKTGFGSPSAVREACTFPSIPYNQVKNGVKTSEEDEFLKESNTTSMSDETVNYKTSEEVIEVEKPSSGQTIFRDTNILSAQSNSKPKHMLLGVGSGLPWHSLLSLLKPNLNIQQLRYKSDKKVADDCDLTANDDCKPRITKLDLPLTCIKKTPPVPPCEIPVQKRWTCCDRSMCLPCCCPIEKPLKCKVFDVKLNTCPRKTYRIAAYSECCKRYGRKQYKKECCYTKIICYAGGIAEREIKPLIHIKDRQALTLGFKITAMCDAPCST
ncbi:uncharacterized protein [Halyomorpha halys]|uniref:uncharacterized protein n=1 Tax=Halyomorpha halys TaxID=286706 RepID=UPI0006D4CCAE|nr:uncharacterized protein LOC106689448 [Halyomorpha halys]